MKKLVLSVSLLVASALGLHAQNGFGGLPASFNDMGLSQSINTADKNVTSNAFVELQKPHMSSVVAEDQITDERTAYRVGINMPANLNMNNSGVWTTASNGDKVWKLSIAIDDAQALGLYFNNVEIPVGAKLFMYNENKSQVIGAFTSATPKMYAAEMIQGDLITIEYNSPAQTIIQPDVDISSVVYFYRGVEDRIGAYRDYQPLTPKAEACQVNVACASEIAGWEDQRDAAVHYTFNDGTGTYVCSAALINNTSEDCTPYILTATHCGEPLSTADLNLYVWYFNYQNPNCSPGATAQYPKPPSTATGATFRASSKNTWGITNTNQVYGTDFTLVELPGGTTLPANAYFAGWDRSTGASPSGVGIHHPAGHDKKISTYTAALTNTTYNGGLAGGHWRVIWSATTNGHGVTEGGSSGSPIFNNNGLIVGMLSGGSSFCAATGSPDLYGKVDVSWDPVGANANGRLKDWLDPTNTGAMTQTGVQTPCAPQVPITDFVASQTNIITGTQITLSDLTSGVPTSWSWTITPGTAGVEYTYAGGTSATDQNPQVTFNTAGIYTVALTATNAQGSDTETKIDYITVTDLTCIDPAASVYTMDFGASADYTGWALLNANNDNAANGGGVWTNLNFGPGGAQSDSLAFAYFWNDDAVTGADDWLFSNCIDMVAGQTYDISFWQRVGDNGAGTAYPENLQLFIGDDQTVAAMTTSLVNLPNNSDIVWTQEQSTFTPTTTGTYYLGFHCTSAADQFYQAIDDINISYTAPAGITITNSPANTTIECDASSLPANTGQLTATTGCASGGLNITYSDVTANGSCANEYTITRTWTITDGCANSETYVQTINVEDNTAPVINCGVSTDQVNTSTGTAPVPNYVTGASATDNCSTAGNIVITQAPVAGSNLTPGTHTITLTSTDECGNTDNCTVTLTIINDNGITIQNSPANTTIECDASDLPANTGQLTAITSCAGAVNINYNDVITNGSCANEYTITRTWTVTDGCANSETYVQTINVEDNTAPVVDCGITTDQLFASAGTTCPDYTAGASATDNCSTAGNIVITQAPIAGSTLATGSNTVTITATDECGNVNTCTIAVTLDDDLGIEDFIFNGLNVYPNPTNGMLNIDMYNVSATDVNITVFDISGKVVFNQMKVNDKQFVINMSSFSKGIYQVRLESENEFIVKKVSKL